MLRRKFAENKDLRRLLKLMRWGRKIQEEVETLDIIFIKL